MVEAPIDEDRSLAVIEEVTRLVPNKPIRFLINTHQHFDHIGGLRTYLHIGATIVTHALNFEFYNRDVGHGGALAADRADRGRQRRNGAGELRHHGRRRAGAC